MGVLDYFKPVASMTPEDVRKFLNERKPQDYNLVDVRQLKEYERGHIPGARLIPVGELADRHQELDPNKPTICY